MTARALLERDEPGVSASGPSLSHSRLNRYLTCPEQYRLHYIERLRPRVPPAILAFGSALHQALAGLFRDGSDPVAAFDGTWRSVADLDLAFGKRDSWDKLLESGIALLRVFLAEAAPRITNVTAVEKPFEVMVTGLPAPLVGVVDLVAELDGKRTVVDFKTAAASYGDHEVVLSDQLSAYLLSEPDAEQAAFCVLLKTREPRIAWHVTTRSAAQLAEYVEKARLIAREIAAQRFYKRPGLWCSWCDFLPVCVGDEATAQATLLQVR